MKILIKLLIVIEEIIFCTIWVSIWVAVDVGLFFTIFGPSSPHSHSYCRIWVLSPSWRYSLPVIWVRFLGSFWKGFIHLTCIFIVIVWWSFWCTTCFIWWPFGTESDSSGVVPALHRRCSSEVCRFPPTTILSCFLVFAFNEDLIRLTSPFRDQWNPWMPTIQTYRWNLSTTSPPSMILFSKSIYSMWFFHKALPLWGRCHSLTHHRCSLSQLLRNHRRNSRNHRWCWNACLWRRTSRLWSHLGISC